MMQKLLRIYMANSTNDKGRPIYEMIIEKAREKGIAGVTVYPQGLAGYGCREGEIRNMVPSLSQTPPIVIDIFRFLYSVLESNRLRSSHNPSGASNRKR